VGDLLELGGVAGYMRETRAARMYADARVQRIYSGTSAKVISRAL
jgi:alkylation response protein AidB-like acyl-CoA dehydrogenase